MSNKFDGPLSYLGVRASNPPNLYIYTRAPLSTDYKKFRLGDIWLEKTTANSWILTDKQAGVATWSSSTSSSGGFVSSFDTDSGAVTPTANNIDVVGGTNIVTSGATNVITVDTADDITISGTLAAGTLNITNAVSFNDTVTITSGGLDVTGTTTLQDLGAGVLTSTAGGVLSNLDGTVGEVLIGGGAGVVPTFGDIRSTGGSITVTATANYIDLEATGSELLTINDQIDSYQLLLSDLSKLVRITKATAVVLTVPLTSTAAFAVGSQVLITQGGAGQLTVTPEVGVTINSPGGRLNLYEQYSNGALIKTGAEEWLLTGDLAA